LRVRVVMGTAHPAVVSTEEGKELNEGSDLGDKKDNRPAKETCKVFARETQRRHNFP